MGLGDHGRGYGVIKPAEKFRFGEWLPDLPELDNPGLLEASNVLWSGGAYVPYTPFQPSGPRIQGGQAIASIRGISTSLNMLYVASTSPQTRNFLSGAFGSSFNFVDLTPPGGLAPSPAATFAQYNNLVIYADSNNNTLYAGVGASTPFATLTGPFGNAPSGLCVGVIGQFVVIANLAP